MAKQFAIQTHRDRFIPPGGPANAAPLIVRDGTAVVSGATLGANPVVLAKPDGNCCCGDEILGCSTCELFENEFFESAYHGCDDPLPPNWYFDQQFDCDNPNDHTLCCRTFIHSPFAHVQMQTALGDYYFPNSCFSMKVFLTSLGGGPFVNLGLNCCITVIGLRFNEAEATAETMQINIEAVGGYTSGFPNVQCDRIVDIKNQTAIDLGYQVNTSIVQWEQVTKVGVNGLLGCGISGNGAFGNACIIKPRNGTIIAQVNESGFDFDVGLNTPYQWPFKRFFDSRDYLTDPSFTTQFQINPDGVTLATDHTNDEC